MVASLQRQGQGLHADAGGDWPGKSRMFLTKPPPSRSVGVYDDQLLMNASNPSIHRSKHAKGKSESGPADWGHLPFGVLEAIKTSMERKGHSQWRSGALLKNGRCVNRHWHSWATGSARALKVSVHMYPCAHLDTLAEHFTSLRHLVLDGSVQSRTSSMEGQDMLARLRFWSWDSSVHLDAHIPLNPDRWMGHVGKLRGLTDLALQFCNFNTTDVIELSSLGALTQLAFYECRHFEDASIAALTKPGSLTSLRTLHLRCCHEVTTSGVMHLRSLKSLTMLSLRGLRRVNSYDVKRGMTSLTHLSITDCCCAYWVERKVPTLCSH